MPLYEYECESCGHRFERIQKVSDPPPAACPTCGGPVHKLMSSPAIQFKGSGWYVTDYARKGAAAPKSGEDSSKPADKAGSADATTSSSSASSSSNDSTSSSDSASKKAGGTPAAKTDKAGSD
jgi:putative FmdB family regulatory protein